MPIHPRCGLLALALPVVAAAAPAGWPEPVHSVQDWDVACDNSGTCRAAGYSPEEYPAVAVAWSVLITRQAGADGAVSVQLQLAEEDEGVPPELLINGQSQGQPVLASPPSIYALDSAQSRALLQAVIEEAEITVGLPDARQGLLSVRGGRAALQRVDRLQGRQGTATAWVDPGEADLSQVPAAVPLPQVTPVAVVDNAADQALATRPSLLAAVDTAWQALGEQCWKRDPDVPLAVAIDSLDADRVLVSTRCWYGAYNQGDVYWVATVQAPHALQRVTVDATDYDGAGRLSGRHKGRGPGDCWRMAEWVWDGTAMVPTLDANTGQCRGKVGGYWTLPRWQAVVKE